MLPQPPSYTRNDTRFPYTTLFRSTAREVDERAGRLERLGDSLEEHRDELMALCIQEAFKSIPDAIAEVREAVDFCRYYAARARADLQSVELPGPTGDRKSIRLNSSH